MKGLEPAWERVPSKPYAGEWAYSVVLVSIVIALTLALNWETTAGLVTMWRTNSAYGHAMWILGVVVFLIWRKRALLSTI
jgi:hypothetical protein